MDSERRSAFIGIGVIALAVLGAGLYNWGGVFPHGRQLRACDEAIKERLKAPATYKRVSYELNGNSASITYDAANGFGVPIRGKGTCWLIGDDATIWQDERDR